MLARLCLPDSVAAKATYAPKNDCCKLVADFASWLSSFRLGLQVRGTVIVIVRQRYVPVGEHAVKET